MSPTPQESRRKQEKKPSTSSPGRLKLTRACDRCRKRRIKCDEGHPCKACFIAKTDCTFDEPGKRQMHRNKHAPTMDERLRRLESLVDAIPSTVFAAGGVTTTAQMTSILTTSLTDPSETPDDGTLPPSLHVFSVAGPSAHFTHDAEIQDMQHNPQTNFDSSSENLGGLHSQIQNPDQLAEAASRISLTTSYLYHDDEGCTRWQGETSGFPILELLAERHVHAQNRSTADGQLYLEPPHLPDDKPINGSNWFSDRTACPTGMNPHMMWKLTMSSIEPQLMDSLVNCYLSTSHYILPFLHIPTFLIDYSNPQKWGEPGFAAFIVAICCLASRHIDDPRVRAHPDDSISAGVHWYELFKRLQIHPTADQPTLYNIQANLIAAVYAVGLGRISRAAALLAESVTMCIDAGLHRSADSYNLFNPIETEVRKRTFWCVYIWDKQLGAHFGRPSLLRLRDCGIGEPTPVDDEYITHEAIVTPPPGIECKMSAFLVLLRIMAVLESVLDVPPTCASGESDPFLLHTTNVLHGMRKYRPMREEEALLDEIHHEIPAYWAHSPETLASEDRIRITQAERLHCAEQFVRLLIYRHRFSEYFAERMCGQHEEEQTDTEREALIAAYEAAHKVVSAHVNIAHQGLMTYYGVHVIHQLTQAGRTLIAVLLCCEAEMLQQITPPGLNALQSCISLLRRFSGRYVCGLRSGDLMEEFCQFMCIPLDYTDGVCPSDPTAPTTRRAWVRRIYKKEFSASRSTYSGESISQHSSPEDFSPGFSSGGETLKPNMFSAVPPATSGSSGRAMPRSAPFDGSKHSLSNVSSTFLDTPTSMGMNMVQEEPELYMQGNMMAFLDDGEVNPLSSPDFVMSRVSGQQQQTPDPLETQQLFPPTLDRQIGGGNLLK